MKTTKIEKLNLSVISKLQLEVMTIEKAFSELEINPSNDKGVTNLQAECVTYIDADGWFCKRVSVEDEPGAFLECNMVDELNIIECHGMDKHVHEILEVIKDFGLKYSSDNILVECSYNPKVTYYSVSITLTINPRSGLSSNYQHVLDCNPIKDKSFYGMVKPKVLSY